MENFNSMRNTKKSVFNVCLVTFIMIIALLGIALVTHQFALMIGISLVGYIGAVIGNAVRLYTAPDMYVSDGTVLTSMKKRFFWSPTGAGYVK